MQAWGVKEKPYNVFQSLRPIYFRSSDNENKFNIGKFKSSLMFQKILKAKSGDKLDIW